MNRLMAIIGALLLVLGLAILGPSAELRFTLLNRAYWQDLGRTAITAETILAVFQSTRIIESLPEEAQALISSQLSRIAPEIEQTRDETISSILDYAEGKNDNKLIVLQPLKTFLEDNLLLVAALGAASDSPGQALDLGKRILEFETTGLDAVREFHTQMRWTSIGSTVLGFVFLIPGLILVLRFGGKGARKFRRLGTPLLIYGLPTSLIFGLGWLVLKPQTLSPLVLLAEQEASSGGSFLGASLLNWMAANLQDIYWMSVMPILVSGLACLGLGLLLKLATPPHRAYYD